MGKKQYSNMSNEELKDAIDKRVRENLIAKLENVEGIVDKWFDRILNDLVASTLGAKKDSFHGWEFRDAYSSRGGKTEIGKRLEAKIIEHADRLIDPHLEGIESLEVKAPKKLAKAFKAAFKDALDDHLRAEVEAQAVRKALTSLEEVVGSEAVSELVASVTHSMKFGRY